MTELFDEDEDLLDEEGFDEEIGIDANESALLDSRRRVENMLAEKKLREELDDFTDY